MILNRNVKIGLWLVMVITLGTVAALLKHVAAAVGIYILLLSFVRRRTEK
jgi:hypothetical protein